MSNEIIKYGNIINEKFGTGFGGFVYGRWGNSPTIRASQSMKDTFVIDKRNDKTYVIRRITPRECWRLMDFTDKDYEKAETVVSKMNLYKQAGNSIVVNVLVAIIGQMIEGKEKAYKEWI